MANIIQELRFLQNTDFDINDEEHKYMLENIWNTFFEETMQIPHQNWKILGFQNINPVSDIRGSGVFGIIQFEYLCTNYKEEVIQMVNNNQPRTIETFPFASAALNISFKLINEKKINNNNNDNKKKNNEQFEMNLQKALNGLSEDDIHEIYVILVKYLDYYWFKNKKTYLEFNSVLNTIFNNADIVIVYINSDMIEENAEEILESDLRSSKNKNLLTEFDQIHQFNKLLFSVEDFESLRPQSDKYNCLKYVDHYCVIS
eukprot:TRINITY_DN960_c0_g1_i2.p1 TRINITY_DN960_c0_g1~~TRINITY_DN960_c0_g1_i2.p1  ORF type:complete len:259 (+),score=49.78 TRINITY_DN960_c0_g1_i2:66-842(+)